MKAIRKLFGIRSDETIMMFVVMLVLLFFHSLIISKFLVLFADYGDSNWNVFMRNFKMSGFDPITYSVLTDWHQGYDIVRHPLLAFMMYPLYLLNMVLWFITGVNCCQIIAGVLLFFCGCYSYLFIYRIFTDVIRLNRCEALLLSSFFFGFAYILVAVIVPDHFCLSLFLLLLTLYVGGMKLRRNEDFTVFEAFVLFFVTAGVTLSNGVCVFLVVLFVNGKRVFRIKPLLLSFTLPSIFLLSLALGIYSFSDASQTSIVSPIAAQTRNVYMDASKSDIMVENFFGESIQLHRKHILGDVLVKRPLIVRYSWDIQYVVEGMIFLFFVVGIWCGRHDRFLWMAMSLFFFALVLHFVLAFGLNEVYIMACHWAFVVPVAIAYIFKKVVFPIRATIFVLLFITTLYLWLYHGHLLFNYLTWPLKYS